MILREKRLHISFYILRNHPRLRSCDANKRYASIGVGGYHMLAGNSHGVILLMSFHGADLTAASALVGFKLTTYVRRSVNK